MGRHSSLGNAKIKLIFAGLAAGRTVEQIWPKRLILDDKVVDYGRLSKCRDKDREYSGGTV